MWFFTLWFACRSEPAASDAPVPPPTGHTALPPHTGVAPNPWEATAVHPGGAEMPALAVAPDGTVHISYAVRSDIDAYTRLFVRSVSPVGVVSDPLQISREGVDVTARWPDGPSIAADDRRILLGFTTKERTDVTAFALELVHGDDAARELTTYKMPDTYEMLSYPVVALHPEGDAWFAFVVAPDTTGRLLLASERDGFMPRDVNAGIDLEVPCECCPGAIGFRSNGRVVAAWRGDVVRDIFIAEGPPDGPMDRYEKVTNSGFEDPICPQDGPTIDTRDGLAIAWSDTRADGSAYLTVEGPEGFTTTPLSPDDDIHQGRVTTASTASGRVVAFDGPLFGGEGYRWAFAEDAGSAPLVGPDGQLREVRLAAAGETIWAVGVDEVGAVWLLQQQP